MGPRGDEKSGARQEWVNYCDQLNIVSKFSSHRSNRFNNVFENAFALVCHHEHVVDFLTNMLSGENLKLQSVVADLQDPNVLSLIGAMSLFNLTITGPYWRLMNSSLPYGSFPVFVKQMKSMFEKFLSLPSFNDHEMVSVFADYPISDEHTLKFVRDKCVIDVVFSTLKTIVRESCDVLHRQLGDFLEGGVYGGEISEDIQKALDACPLTNLTGERLFGDLDYDFHRRKRASLHMRSTLNMWKHNNTAEWFYSLSEDKQREILEQARKNANLYDASKKSETEVHVKIKEKLIENKRKRCEKDIRDKEKKASILRVILADGGVCESKDELDDLMQRGNLDT